MAALTQEIFLDRAYEVHGGTYDYSKVIYEKMHTKVDIVCKERVNRRVGGKPTQHYTGEITNELLHSR